jgi:hypothetical protein
MGAESFVVVVKAQWGEGGGRILLGDNTGGGTVMLRPVKLQCAGSSNFNWTALCVCVCVCVRVRVYIYMYSDHMYSPDCAKS